MLVADPCCSCSQATVDLCEIGFTGHHRYRPSASHAYRAANAGCGGGEGKAKGIYSLSRSTGSPGGFNWDLVPVLLLVAFLTYKTRGDTVPIL